MSRLPRLPLLALLSSSLLLALACSGSDSGSELTGTGGTGGSGGGLGGSATAGSGTGGSGTAGKGGDVNAKNPCAGATENFADGQKTGTETCDNGATHLADDVASCPFVEKPGVTCSTGSMGGPPGACSMDAECGSAGRCELQSGGAGQFCTCRTYCKVDADCPMGSTCVCGAQQGSCVKAACESDKDCTAGLCLSVHQKPATGACGTPPPSFACTSESDACFVDADCGAKKLCVLDGASRVCVDAPPECPPVP